MALNAMPYSCSMQITYHMGVDDEGREKKLTRSLTGLKTDQTDEDLYDLVNVITNLQKHVVTGIIRVDRTMFEEE